MLDPDLIERIRTIFLHDQPYVSIADATALLGWSRSEMTAAISAREIEPMYTCSGKAIKREDIAAKALELWPVETIEEALGSKAKSTLPEAIRTRELRARLPRYQLAMLEYIAEREQTTIGRVLSRELDDLANARAEELSSAIPGFSAALAWPELDETQQPS